jgi:peptide/nickel transport system substrate-binding protein
MMLPTYLLNSFDTILQFDETRIMSGLFRAFLFSLLSVFASQSPLPAQPSSAQTEFLTLNNLEGFRGGNLVVAVSSDPSNFNHMLTSGLSTSMVTERLSADLVHINRSTTELEPSLASRWESDKSGRIYTIHLRRGVHFSDGGPFTADDVLFSLQALEDPKTASQMAGQVEIDGVFPSAVKLDDYTVRLTFQRPVGMGLRMLDTIPMLPKKNLLKAYQQGRLAAAWGPTAAPGDVVGLGPFKLREYQRGFKVVLERNPYYWKKDRAGRTLPYLDTITFLIVPDLNTEALRFQQGELDMISSPSLTPDNYAVLRRAQKDYFIKDLGPGLLVDFLWFNLNRPQRGKAFVDPEKLAIFDNPEFRRAISYALDRKGMNRSILLGLGVPQYGLISSGNSSWYDPGISPTDYSPARARELLKKTGLRDINGDGILEFGSKGRPLEISLFTSRGNRVREKSAQVIQDNLSKIGIRVGVQLLLPNEIASRFLDSFEYEAILFGFSPTDVAPDLQTDLWNSSGKIHFWCPGQPRPEHPWEATVDSLISTLVRTGDPAVRRSAFNRAQEIWNKEMPAIPTIAPDIFVAWRNGIGNIRPAITAPHLIWNAEEITKRPGR